MTVEATAAAAFALLAWRVDSGLILFGLCWATAWAAALAFTDVAVQRLPNRLVGPAVLGLLVAQLAAAATTHGWRALVTAVLCGLGLLVVYFLLALAPTKFGIGDVKLAALIGLATGWFSIGAMILALISALMIHGLAAGVTAIRRRSLAGSIAHGPSMLAGALVAILAAG